MAQNKEWGSSSIKPAYTNGGNNLQTPKPFSCSSSVSQSRMPFVVSSGPSSKSSTARCQGWSAYGIKRFNELFDLVEKERMSSYGPQFDKHFLKHCMQAREQGRKKNSKNAVVYEACRHTLWTTTAPVKPSCFEETAVDCDESPSDIGSIEDSIADDEVEEDNASVGFEGFTFEA